MRKSESTILGLATMAGFAALSVQAAPPGDDPMPAAVDYAWDWPIEEEKPDDFYELELRLDVYRSVTDPSLRDIGVYDSSWHAVPRLIGPPADSKPVPESTARIAALPVLAPAGLSVGDMRLALVRSEAGTRVQIVSGTLAAAAGPATLVAYVADLGEERTDLRGIGIEWPREIEPVIARVTIEGSSDFDRWFRLGNGAIAGLRQDSASIERRRIDVANHPVRYLRLSWDSVPAGWRIDRLTAFFAPPAPAIDRDWLSMVSTGRDPADRGYLFDIGGSPPVDRLNLELPDGTSLVRASIYAWLPDRQVWLPVHDGSFYRLRRDGNAVTSDAATIPAQRSSRWKVKVERGAGELQFGFQVGWRSDRLHFIAQGQGPWRLVAGNAVDLANGFPQERRYADPAMRGLLEKSDSIGHARLGARQELGGSVRLESVRTPEWRRWLLWIGLAGGVLLVGFMVLRLARQPAASGPGA